MATKKTAPAKKATIKTTVTKSAKTGEFVTSKHAESHPATTFKQTVTKPATPSPGEAKASAVKKALKSTIKSVKELTVQQLVSVLNEPQNAKAKKAVIEHVKQASAEAKAFIDRPSRNVTPKMVKAAKAVAKEVNSGKPSKERSALMKHVDKALNVTNSRPPDIDKAAEAFAKTLSPKSQRNIAQTVSKAPAKKTVALVSGRAEVKESAVQDARAIFR